MPAFKFLRRILEKKLVCRIRIELNNHLLISRNFAVVIFKKYEEQMYGEGPVLLSLIANQTVNILPQLREELKEMVRKHGFR